MGDIHDSSLYNEDLAPVPPARRTWTLYNYASLWVAMSVCIDPFRQTPIFTWRPIGVSRISRRMRSVARSLRIRWIGKGIS